MFIFVIIAIWAFQKYEIAIFFSYFLKKILRSALKNFFIAKIKKYIILVLIVSFDLFFWHCP